MLENLIKQRHPAGKEWVTIEEFRNSTGGSQTGAIDVAAFNCWPSNKYYRIAYEVKRSRGDFLRELKNPGKRKWVEEFFHETYFVVDDNSIVLDEEVPDGWGLLSPTKTGDKLRRRKVARPREPKEPPTGFWMSLARRLSEDKQKIVSSMYSIDNQSFTQEEFKKLLDEKVYEGTLYERDRLKKEQDRLEKATREYQESLSTLEEPFRALTEITVGRYYFNRTQVKTTDDVESLVESAVLKRLESKLKHVEAAHHSLGQLLLKSSDQKSP